MNKKEWISWLKCNALEIVILILVLVLLVKVFSAPAVEGVSKTLTIEEPSVPEGIPAGEASAEEAVIEAPVEEIPTK